MRLLRVVVIVAMVASPAALASEPGPDHTAWEILLWRHVDEDGRVDYHAWHSAERSALDAYLQRLAAADVSRLTKQEALVFWINAYNACVVKGVLDRYPIRSVKDVPGFFDRIACRVAGESLTLNAIETRGRQLGDWRIHFALVCASSSCPSLRREAYVAGQLDEQLTEQTRNFLADPQRGMRVESQRLRLSKIFDWYKTDFIPASELGWLGRLTPEKLLLRLEPYLDRQVTQAIRSRRLAVGFLDYDWSLNELRN